MLTQIVIQNSGTVNYTNVPTSASNEVYVPMTEPLDSLSSLIKNKVIVSYSLIPQSIEPQIIEEEPFHSTLTSAVAKII